MPKRKRAEEKAPASAPASEKDQETNGANEQKPNNAFEVQVEGKRPIQCERHGKPDSKPDLIFTHGAGGGLTAPAMQDFASGFSQTSSLVTFKGNMNLKSRISSFQKVIEHEDCDPSPALGGRSMGARAACLAAQEFESKVDALVLVSFPLVGAQKQDSREQILLDLPEGVDVLFVSGTEDSMCDLEHLSTVVNKMKARSWIVECESADHGMSLPRQKDGSRAMRVKTGEVAAEWLRSRDEINQFLLLRWDDDQQTVESEGWHEGA